LSPTKGAGLNRSGYSDTRTDASPISSNVSSFYYDRIEELLPEKKLIAEKLYRNLEIKP
jgi:hypothetical protein